MANGVLVDSSVLLAEIGSLGEDLINRADVGTLAGVKKILDEVSANETGTTKNEDVRHFFLLLFDYITSFYFKKRGLVYLIDFFLFC